MSVRKSTRKNVMATGASRATKQVRTAKDRVQAPQTADGDEPVESEPAVERGERIQTGKVIARGGGGTAPVKGATANAGKAKSPRTRRKS